MTVSAGSHSLGTVVSAGSKRSWTILIEAKYDSLHRKPCFGDSSLCRKQEIMTEAKYDRPSQQEVKTGRLVSSYTL